MALDTGCKILDGWIVDTLFEIGSIKDEELYQQLHQKLELLGKKINKFLQAVENNHNVNRA